ncbi:hypothetical protein LCGC14_1816970, partial [marine sediment metagenome]
MIPAALQADFWQRVPAILLIPGAIIGLTGWVLLYRLGRRYAAAGVAGILHNFRAAAILAARVALGFVGIWLTFHVIGQVFVLATSWPLWPVALAAALLAEGLIWLYVLERRLVTRKMGLILTGLRVALAVVLALMLIQPVWVSIWTETRQRTVAILVDESASMHIPDRMMPPHQKLRLAEAFSIPSARRPYRLEEQARLLRRLRGELLGELNWLNGLAAGKGQGLKGRLTKRRKALNKQIKQWQKTAAGVLAPLESVLKEVQTLPKPIQAALMDAKAKITKGVCGPLKAAAGWTDKDQAEALPGNFKRLHDAVRRAVGELGRAAPALDLAAEALDKVLYEQLGPADRQAVDAAAEMTRIEVARAVLLHKPTAGKKQRRSLLDRLGQDYNIEVFTFAGSAARADPQAWTDPVASPAPKAAPQAAPTTPPGRTTLKAAKFDDRQLQTDLAGALKHVLSKLGKADLAAVVVLTDGQDNGPEQVEPQARQMGSLGIAFYAVAVGGEKPPADAAIISVECPDTVYKEDRMYVNAELKLDGLDGRQVSIVLLDGKQVVAKKEIRVAGDAFRTRIQMADEPKTVGLHSYRLKLTPSADKSGEKVEEVFTDNNTYAISLAVTDDRAKVLLVDSRPRWEYRYLKNLFTGRDKTVKLQYVLTRPDKYFGQPTPTRTVHASASRPMGAEEAAALPESLAEWMKFDVVILGDMALEDFGPRLSEKEKKTPAAVEAAAKAAKETVRTIRKFVADRGGSLILIAGPNAMPAAHVGGELADLIPFDLKAPDGPAAPAAANKPFKLSPRGVRIVPPPE